MKCKCLLKADSPNANGVVYPREVLEKAIEEFNKKDFKAITKNADSSVVHLSDVIGSISKAGIEDDGSVYVEASPVKPELFEMIKYTEPLNSTCLADLEDIEESSDGVKTVQKCEIVSFSLSEPKPIDKEVTIRKMK